MVVYFSEKLPTSFFLRAAIFGSKSAVTKTVLGTLASGSSACGTLLASVHGQQNKQKISNKNSV